MAVTGIDIGLSVTCVVNIDGDNISVVRFGSNIGTTMKNVSEDTPLDRYNMYGDALENCLYSLDNVGTVIMENPHTKTMGNSLRLYTLRGCYLRVLSNFVPDKKLKHPTPTEIKKFWTGQGNATKDMMIETCEQKSHLPDDDHEADATAMAYMGWEYYQCT